MKKGGVGNIGGGGLHKIGGLGPLWQLCLFKISCNKWCLLSTGHVAHADMWQGKSQREHVMQESTLTGSILYISTISLNNTSSNREIVGEEESFN